jgi:hypothetical protein
VGEVLTDQQNNNRKTHREDNQTPTEKQFKKHKHTGKRRSNKCTENKIGKQQTQTQEKQTQLRN